MIIIDLKCLSTFCTSTPYFTNSHVFSNFKIPVGHKHVRDEKGVLDKVESKIRRFNL